MLRRRRGWTCCGAPAARHVYSHSHPSSDSQAPAGRHERSPRVAADAQEAPFALSEWHHARTTRALNLEAVLHGCKMSTATFLRDAGHEPSSRSSILICQTPLSHPFFLFISFCSPPSCPPRNSAPEARHLDRAVRLVLPYRTNMCDAVWQCAPPNCSDYLNSWWFW